MAGATVAVALAGCGSSGSASDLSALRLHSPGFGAGGTIPRTYTCDGPDTSPPLRWSGVPAQATMLELMMRDPDAPNGNFIHWRVSQIPASTDGLAAGRVPPGTREGRNSFGTTGYRGPCPPHGDTAHHYVITVTARRGSRVLAVGTLTGTYAR